MATSGLSPATTSSNGAIAPTLVVGSSILTRWDPTEKNEEIMLPWALERIKRDIASLCMDPLPGILAIAEESDISRVHALITGPEKTPYEGGFFYFLVKFPPDYPIQPPKIKMMTTANSTVRFNPNIYQNGKVCLSILGTWSGPGWSPASTLASVLLSIQSLMGENPYHNEPGFEKSSGSRNHRKQAEDYNEIIIHETIRVAVCDMIEGVNRDTDTCPQHFKDGMQNLFILYYDHYLKLVNERINLTGTPMCDPFGDKRGRFNYAELKQRLEHIYRRICEKRAKEAE